MSRDATDRWCILRCSGVNTVKLATSLTEAGFEVWTPVEEETTPITASYVFARLHHLQELLALSHSPSLLYQVWDAELKRMVTRGHPYFRLMRGLDPFIPWAVVSDAQVAPLRGLERSKKPRGLVKLIPIGTKVRLDDRGFTGIDGVVVSARGKFVTVQFEGLPFPVDKIPCWQLTETLDESPAVHVDGFPSEQVARAA
jgi:hypothetical protein